jgi:hypothetical protein
MKQIFSLGLAPPVARNYGTTSGMPPTFRRFCWVLIPSLARSSVTCGRVERLSGSASQKMLMGLSGYI